MEAVEEKGSAKQKPNIAFILTTVFSILFLCLSVFFYLGREQERQQRLNVENKLEQTVVAKKVVEKNLKETLEKNEELTSQTKELETQVSEVQEQLTQMEEENRTLALDYEKDQQRMRELEETLQAEQRDKETLAKDLEKIKSDYAQLEKKAGDLEQEKIALEVQVKPTESTPAAGTGVPPQQQAVALGKITVEAKTPLASGQGKNGRILVVNDEFNFVVVSFGKSDGLKGGEVLSIFRDGQFLGKVQVEKLYDAISAATILEGKTGLYREGDIVRL